MFLKNKYDESCSNLAAAIRKIKGKQRFYCLALNGVQQTSPKIIGKLSCGHIVTKKQNEIQFTEKNPTKYAEFEKKKQRRKPRTPNYSHDAANIPRALGQCLPRTGTR